MIQSALVQQYRAACSAAIGTSLGFAPEASSLKLGWSNFEMFSWRGEADQCAYETLHDTVVIVHIGGKRKVPVEIDCSCDQFQSRHGTLTIVPPGSAITWRVNGAVHSYSIHLAASCFGGLSDRMSKSMGDFLPFRCGIQDPVLASLVSALADEFAAPSQIGPIYGESLADSIGLYIARSAMQAKDPYGLTGGLSPKNLRAVLDSIEAHLDRGISLQALADSIQVSRAYFSRSFRQSMGISPHAYVTRRRIQLAKDLLKSSRPSLCDIALSCGFSSQAHFTAQFRRETGRTPAKYRSLGDFD